MFIRKTLIYKIKPREKISREILSYKTGLFIYSIKHKIKTLQQHGETLSCAVRFIHESFFLSLFQIRSAQVKTWTAVAAAPTTCRTCQPTRTRAWKTTFYTTMKTSQQSRAAIATTTTFPTTHSLTSTRRASGVRRACSSQLTTRTSCTTT